MRRATVVCGLIGVSCVAASERVHAAEPGDVPFETPPAERRAGFTIGVSTGLALSAARGYPNDVAKIDLPEFEASAGAALGSSSTLWLGGALTDWLTLAVGLQAGSFEADGIEASGGSFHVRIESFPLFYRGGAFRDLGLSFSAGTGNYELQRAGDTVAEGEGASAVGAGVFFEPWRFWQFSTGPELSYAHQFSRSLSAHSLVVGWRLAFYGGP